MPRPLQILVVCTANICRSPAAAVLLRRELADVREVQVSSAGVAAVAGSAACDLSSALVGQWVARHGSEDAAASTPGEPGADHAARLLSESLLTDADLVLALDRSHRAALARLDPDSRRLTFTLRQAARLSDAVVAVLTDGERPPGSPPLPALSEDRLRWFVGELDAARAAGATTPAAEPASGGGHRWHEDDVPDPHTVGYQVHPMALELVADAVTRLTAGLRVVLSPDRVHQSRA